MEWDGPVPYSADDLVRPSEVEVSAPAREQAADFLKDALAAGPRLARELFAEAEALGISEKTLRRAKGALGVVAERRGGFAEKGGWFWDMPSTAAPDSDAWLPG